MTDEAVILAGGLGTRLRDVVSDIPKSMAPVNNKPFLAYLMDYLLKNGIKRVVLSVGYMHEKILKCFHNNYKGIELIYSMESEPLGTGGAVALAMKSVISDEVLILNGDTLFDVDLKGFYDFYIKKHADILLALRFAEDASRYGSVFCDDTGRITAFREKETIPVPGLINGGIYLMKKNYLNLFQLSAKFSLEKDCYAKCCKESYIYGYVTDDYFLDIGIPGDYNKAQNEFKRFENG
jgi:D-glycero-alpha-D-manno-heptose 1-phosphate guanylyltransferase